MNPDPEPAQPTPQDRRGPQSAFLYLNGQGGLALGDAIIHLPFIRSLKEWAPEVRITVTPGNGGVRHLMPLFAPFIHEAVDVIPDPTREKFDWVFDLVGESAAMAFRLRKLARKRFYTTACRGLLNLPRLPLYHGKHVVRRNLGLFKQATGQHSGNLWPWPVPPAYREAAKSLLSEGPAYIAIAPGTGDIARRKHWPRERYVELAKLQSERGRVPLIFLGPNEAGWEKYFAGIPHARFPLSENNPVHTGVPTDPTLTVALSSRVSAAVTNCCGAGHMFALGGAPLVSLFGPTKYLKSAPFARNGICVLPSVEGSRRMEDILLEDVTRALDTILFPEPKWDQLDIRVFRRVSHPEIRMNP